MIEPVKTRQAGHDGCHPRRREAESKMDRLNDGMRSKTERMRGACMLVSRRRGKVGRLGIKLLATQLSQTTPLPPKE